MAHDATRDAAPSASAHPVSNLDESLPYTDLLGRFRSLFGSLGNSRSFSDLMESNQLSLELEQWCTHSLAEGHLVEVAATLHSELNIFEREMKLLGIPVDLLECFPRWREGLRDGFEAPRRDLSPPLFGASHKFNVLRLQLSPFSPTLSAALLLIRRLIENLDESVRFSVAMEPGGNLEALHEIISEFGKGVGERVSMIELPMMSVFAQDNARGARFTSGEPLLLIPRAFRRDRERAREALDPTLGSASFGIPLMQSRLLWEGGNVINDDHCCFIGVDHLRENMCRLGLRKEEVISLFHSEFGPNIEFLGNFDDTSFVSGEFRSFASGQASFHIDLDLHVMGSVRANEAPVAFLASPELGLKYADFVLSKKRLVADHFMAEEQARDHIGFEYRAYAQERVEKLRGYREVLLSKGYKIFELPDLRIDPMDNLFGTRNLDFTYCNVLSASHRGEPTIFYLPFRVPPLDEAAERAYREAGCRVVRVSHTGRLANLLMLFRGGLRCACSQVY